MSKKYKKKKKITEEQRLSLDINNEYTLLAKQSCEYMLTKGEIQQTMVKISPKANE